MSVIEEILSRFGEHGVEASFRVEGRRYHCFAYTSPGRKGPCVRWNLYTVASGDGKRLRGLTFGISRGVEEAIRELVAVAQSHARTGTLTGAPRRGFTFRPAPQD